MGDDAKKDTVDNPSPDVPNGPETPIVKPDAGPDAPVSVPDSSPDKPDLGIGNKDATNGDARNPADVTDGSPPPADVPLDNATGAESGPEPPAAEPGPEPQNGPEPSSKPEPQNGPEPQNSPEPGPEPQNGPEPGPEPPRDGGTTPASNCNIFYGSAPSTGSQGHPPGTNSTAAFCVATCDDIAGWGCSNDSGRTYTVNGTTVACGATISKKNGYYVFQVSAGSNASAAIYWWVSGSWASSCPAPDGGVFP